MDIISLRKHRCVYLIGIGGISMSALAMILREKGYEVRGYDRTESETVVSLRNAGIRIWLKDDRSAFDGVDLVCYSAAIPKDHPQMRLAMECGAEILSRAELLGCLAASYSRSVAVAGTHGKSTTSGMLSHIFLHSEHADPTVLVGAVLPELSSTYRIGTDQNFIFEACEYKDSFLSFYPSVAVVLNIQLDHTDYFHSIEQMIDSFTQFLQNTGKDGICIVNADCEHCMTAAKGCSGRLLTFSASGNESADYSAKQVDLSDGFGEFDVYRRGSFFLHVKLHVPGEHNIANALAAVVAADVGGLSPQEISDGLSGYTGVCRRFEYLGECNGARVFDDYAHHPDEIRATLAAAKAITKGRVLCAFQPHNYSRLHDLFDDFCTSFTDADLLILTKLYAAREAAGQEVSSALLAEKTGAVYIENKELLPAYIRQIAKDGDTVLIMGAGDIGEVAKKFKKVAKIP